MSNIKDDPDTQRGKSSDVKPKMIELDRKIGNKSVMSIWKLFIDRYELSHLVDQTIHEMEGIGDASSEEASGMDQFFAAALLVDVAVTLWVSVDICFLHG